MKKRGTPHTPRKKKRKEKEAPLILESFSCDRNLDNPKGDAVRAVSCARAGETAVKCATKNKLKNETNNIWPSETSGGASLLLPLCRKLPPPRRRQQPVSLVSHGDAETRSVCGLRLPACDVTERRCHFDVTSEKRGEGRIERAGTSAGAGEAAVDIAAESRLDWRLRACFGCSPRALLFGMLLPL